MSATVHFFLRPVPGGGPPYQKFPHKMLVTRVPSVAEIVSMGEDQYHDAANYVVELVHHCPDKPNGIDAEVYARRVSVPKEIGRATGQTPNHEAEWPADAWPVFKGVDHREPGWFVPAANDAEHAAFLKASVLSHIRKHYGDEVVESGCERVQWVHEGRAFVAVVGEHLDFYGVVGHVWCILKKPNLWFVVTTFRGAVEDGPILIGLPASDAEVARVADKPRSRRK